MKETVEEMNARLQSLQNQLPGLERAVSEMVTASDKATKDAESAENRKVLYENILKKTKKNSIVSLGEVRDAASVCGGGARSGSFALGRSQFSTL